HLVLFRDLSDRKETERRQKLASTVFNVAANAIVITDSANNILTVNPAFTKITGYESEEVVGRNPRFLQSGRHEAAFYSELWGEITGKGSWEGEIWNRKKNGEIYPEWLSINAVRDESGAITHHVAIFADITDRKLSEERVQYLAHFDPLTDLPNRVLFRDRLDQAIARCARSRTRFALLFIDLDRFKTINDTLGHHVGDIYLREAASRMSHLLRRSDTVARLSGDEFIAIVNDVRHPAHAGQVAQKLIEQVGLPTSVQGHELIITPSIGISVYPEDGEAADDLLRHADAAMYEAKRLGRSRYVFFTGGLADRARERARRENALRKAVANGDFTLHYQPLLDLTTGDVIGIEALIRAKPETGLGGPAEFIPLAEEIGLIQQIDRWVLAAASRQARAWREAGRRLVPISVNISPAHLRDPGFVDDVVGTIVLSGARPEDIELELTETAIMDNIDQAAAAFADLRARGMRLAVDDFGTGYSSLTRLRRLPIHRIKIDRSFVRGLTDGGEDKAIVNAILQIAKGMRLRTVAEGVERQEEYNVLLDLGCDAVQGFLFQRPVPPEEVVTDFIAMPMRTGPG
ncbi:MAG: EAL domain-containing protein, partial [Alphaproteobacteria bacterium]|nr:EAL domain-containing protein [Alphaproteobacteria bacterium]